MTRLAGFYVLGVYVVENTLFTALARGSFGQLVTGLRVVRVDQPGRGSGCSRRSRAAC